MKPGAGRKTLIVITGPTASGKTAVAVEVARRLSCEIISADSRQIYRDIPIVSAAPTEEEMRGIPHHLVGTLPADAYYSAARFEADALGILERIWEGNRYAVVCGGSMMYIDALTDGIDDMPDISADVRGYVSRLAEASGMEGVMAQLEILDPEYAKAVDTSNPKRVIHALEVTIAAGKPYTSLLTGKKQSRPFEIIKVALTLPRQELFERINTRVDSMISHGLIEEARSLYHLRSLNSLNTVGLKELFAYYDGEMDLPTAIERIKKNTRVYAKKQLTWLSRAGVRPSVFLHPATAADDILRMLSTN